MGFVLMLVLIDEGLVLINVGFVWFDVGVDGVKCCRRNEELLLTSVAVLVANICFLF